MPAEQGASLSLAFMELDDGLGDDEPERPLLPPDDRLWRHPSEIASHGLPGGRSLPMGRRVRRSTGRGTFGSFLSGAVGAVLVIGLVTAVGGFRVRNVPVRSVEHVAVTDFNAVAPPARVTEATAEIVDKVHPAMVHVRAERPEGVLNGSGFVFREDGHIFTAQRLIEGARRVVVTLSNAAKRVATIVGTDPDTAIGVLKVDPGPGGAMTTAPLGTSTTVKPGQTAIAVGMPTWVSVSVVAAVGRVVESKNSPLLIDMIDLNAGFDPLASGGPLLDGRGAVIGVTSVLDAKGYATPIDIARDVADQLIRTGGVVYVWLGIEGEDADSDLTKRLGIEGGALVTSVAGESPAYLAGVHPGDVITDMEDVRIGSMAGLKIALRSKRSGQAVTLKLLRDGQPVSVNATLIERGARY
jgi:serine protease Do